MARTERYPPQVKYIVGKELCERFSFYGMRSILTLYMMQYLLFAQQDAMAYFRRFLLANYLTPLLGGWIADRFWGRYRTILWISLGYSAGTPCSRCESARGPPRRPLAHRARAGASSPACRPTWAISLAPPRRRS